MPCTNLFDRASTLVAKANSSRLSKTIVLRKMDTERQFRRPVSNGSHPGLWLSGHFQSVDPARNFVEQHVRLQLGEHAADTGMYAVSPTDLLSEIPRNLVAVWIRPGTRVAICCCKHQAHPLAGGNTEAFDFDFTRRDPAGHPRW